ncbi:endolytic transglycosylase MltG [Streptococcus oricebi]|uniref:Endolytic murein transglycosylase n=1 Tax=Streptococcus oricebi TaxID=1547447 RepID=A0ABS5B3K7_9STRE|nr:endolytic transglycosylase MltG [Streptococcus oricebi]MBP2623423.1 endolytic transglycosylase MltG [Streptococcus oricebi]
MTENSQENEKNLSFKEQILRDLAQAKKEAEDQESVLEDEGIKVASDLKGLASQTLDSSSKPAEEAASKEEPAYVEFRSEDIVSEDSAQPETPSSLSQEVSASQQATSTDDDWTQPLAKETVPLADDLKEDKEFNSQLTRVPVSYKTEKISPIEEPEEEKLAYRQERPEKPSKEADKFSRAKRVAQDQQKKRQNNVAKKIVWTVLSLLLLGLAVTGLFYYNYVTDALKAVDSKATEYVTVEVPQGSSAKEIGRILEKEGLIKSSQVFNFYSKFKNYSNFQSGYYNLQKSMDLDTIAKTLQKGGTETPQAPSLGKLTIPEGYTLEQIAKTVGETKSKKVSISADDFLAKVQDENFISQLVAKYPRLLSGLPSKESGVKYRLEGYLFPATYNYTPETTVESLIDEMVAAMDNSMAKYYDDLSAKNLTVNDVLTMASLVEKEGSTDQDRKDIAGVFYNRLNQGMPLQSNIAILYAQGKLGQKTTLAEDAAIDTEIDSAYNVYKNTGLMPGPVDSPSLSAIEAVVNPNKTDYLYFLADTETGTVYYSNTYEEHAKNVEEHINSKLNQAGGSN